MGEVFTLFIKFTHNLPIMVFIPNLILIVELIHNLLRFVHIDIHNHLLLLVYVLLQFRVVIFVQPLVKVELLKFLKCVITNSLKHLQQILEIFGSLVIKFPLHFFVIVQNTVVICRLIQILNNLQIQSLNIKLTLVIQIHLYVLDHLRYYIAIQHQFLISLLRQLAVYVFEYVGSSHYILFAYTFGV